jgi:hypothetical protein
MRLTVAELKRELDGLSDDMPVVMMFNNRDANLEVIGAQLGRFQLTTIKKEDDAVGYAKSATTWYRYET